MVDPATSTGNCWSTLSLLKDALRRNVTLILALPEHNANSSSFGICLACPALTLTATYLHHRHDKEGITVVRTPPLDIMPKPHFPYKEEVVKLVTYLPKLVTYLPLSQRVKILLSTLLVGRILRTMLLIFQITQRTVVSTGNS